MKVAAMLRALVFVLVVSVGLFVLPFYPSLWISKLFGASRQGATAGVAHADVPAPLPEGSQGQGQGEAGGGGSQGEGCQGEAQGECGGQGGGAGL